MLRHVEVAQETQNRLDGDLRRARFPMLAAFDQQCAARIVLVVEERVVAQPPARRVPAVDHDMAGRAHRSSEREPLAPQTRHRQRRAGLGHRMQVEQMVDAIVEGSQLARSLELGALARAFEHVGRPQPVEILVDAARRERVTRVETQVRVDIGEDDRQRAARRAHVLAHRPIERNRAADAARSGSK